jgi:hypothetical protein
MYNTFFHEGGSIFCFLFLQTYITYVHHLGLLRYLWVKQVATLTVTHFLLPCGPKFISQGNIQRVSRSCHRNLSKCLLLSTLDKVIYYIGTFLQGLTKLLFTSQNRAEISWKKICPFYFQHACSRSRFLWVMQVQDFFNANRKIIHEGRETFSASS